MITVIIPSYDNVVETLTCINSLRMFSDNPYETLVQDDASPHVNLCAVVPPEIASTERNPVNLGFAGTVNAAFRRASKLPFVMLVNQDVFGVEQFSRGWDTAIKQAFSDPKVGAVACRLLFEDGSIQSVGGEFDAGCAPYHRCIGYKNLNHPDIAMPRDVSWATGAALAFRREVFEQIGGLDEAYRMYFEDVAACLKVRELGYTIRYTPGATFVHPAGSTGGSPHFLKSTRTFKTQWVDTGKITPDVGAVKVRYW
jgi:O-antigen biosynthesis protein